MGNSGIKHLVAPDSGSEDIVYGDDWEDLVTLLDSLLTSGQKVPYSATVLTSSIVNADVAVGAAISESKLSLTYATHAENHKDRHKTSGADAFVVTDLLDCLARVDFKKDGVSVGKRRGLNFVAGSGATVTVSDDSGNEEVDVTIGLSGGEGGVYKLAPTYFIYKSGSTWYAEDRDGNLPFSSASGIGGIINSCIAAISSGCILIAEGTHTVETKINMTKSNVQLAGVSWGTVLSLANSVNTHVIEVTGDYCLCYNLSIDGNKSGQSTGHGIFNHGNNNAYLYLSITDVKGDCLHTGESGSWNNDSMGGKIGFCRFTTPDGNCLYMDYTATDYEVVNMLLNTASGSGKGGLVVDGANCRFSNFHIWGCYYDLLIAPSHTAEGLSFTNMGFMDNTNHVVCKGSSAVFKDSHFTGCTFWGKLSSGSATRDCFYVSSSGSMRCVTVTGCTFRGDDESGNKDGRYAVNWGSNVTYCVFACNTVEKFSDANPVQISGTGCINEHNALYDNG